MGKPVNTLSLTGQIVEMPVFSHDVFGEAFYQLTLAVPRLSGVKDMLPVTACERLLEGVSPQPDMLLHLDGQVRSYNKMIDGAGRLLITALRKSSPSPRRTKTQTSCCSAARCAGRRRTGPRHSGGKLRI